MGQVPGICIRGALCFDKNITKLKNLHCDSPMVYFESNPGPKPVEDSTQMLMFMIVFLNFIQSWIFNMRVSERLGSLVFIQKHFSQRTQQLPRGNFSSQVFIHKHNFGRGNLKCSRHKHLNLSKGFLSPDLAVLT